MEKNIKCLKLHIEYNTNMLIVGMEGGHLHFLKIDIGGITKKSSKMEFSQTNQCISKKPKSVH